MLKSHFASNFKKLHFFHIDQNAIYCIQSLLPVVIPIMKKIFYIYQVYIWIHFSEVYN